MNYLVIDGTANVGAISIVMGSNYTFEWNGPAETLPERFANEHVAPTVKIPENGLALSEVTYKEEFGKCKVTIPGDLILAYRNTFGWSEIIMERDEEGWVVTVRHRERANFNPTAAKLMNNLTLVAARVETKEDKPGA